MPTDISESDRKAFLSKMHYLLSRTSSGSTICPSQIPRSLHDTDPSRYPNWRDLMDPVRQIVWEQVNKGNVQVTQKGEIRSFDQRNDIKGPIRVKKGEHWNESLIQSEDE
ncbi:uncharacterized protein IL334_002857 [Kwoniella shivajii]|uniref:Uncharacterized protein n=1 Tax=Kwoniella shivajii TaxID=564305 RepID=A0ABZ1CVV9_9TREE|nr:hypothetical protein IL334_002857 [Kwoniella shivajii]